MHVLLLVLLNYIQWGIKVHHLKHNNFFKIEAKDLIFLFDMLEGLDIQVNNFLKLLLFGIVKKKI